MIDVKYGLYCYETSNIGDEIQSIAARRFLPKVDYYINRDNIDELRNKKGTLVKLIMNGWYMEPFNGHKKWPPKNHNIDPLLISMHVNKPNSTIDVFSSVESINFLRSHGPVGARDLATKEFFESIGVDSYFSGCLTLSILPDKSIKKQDFILAADVSEAVYKKMCQSTNRQVIRLNTEHDKKLDRNERFALAEYWLYIYQSAHCVVTQRLHVMLPCLALGTPVIALSGRDYERYSGLIELCNNMKEKDFLDNDINLDSPSPNPKDFCKLRNINNKRCKQFTNFDSKKSFLNGKTTEQLLLNPCLLSALTKSVDSGALLESANAEIKFLKSKSEQLGLALEEKEQLAYELLHPGIKASIKYLKKALKSYIKRHL